MSREVLGRALGTEEDGGTVLGEDGVAREGSGRRGEDTGPRGVGGMESADRWIERLSHPMNLSISSHFTALSAV